MTTMLRALLISALVSCSPVSVMAAEHWNQFRGATGDARTSTPLPVKFGESSKVRWKTPIHGKGFSSPVVWEDQAWLTTATPDGKELFAIAVDLESGEKIHDIKVFEIAEPQRGVVDDNSYASPTPVVEDGRVYVHYGSAGTACLDSQTGDKIWERTDFVCDHETRPASSPIVEGDRLFIAFDGIDLQYFVALNKHTGETVWKRDRGVVFEKPGFWDNKDFGTARLIEHQGRKQLISPAAKVVISYNPETGEEYWRASHSSGENNGCRPLYENGLVYICGGSGETAVAAIDPSGSGDVTDTHIVWKAQKGAPLYSSVVISDGLFFMISNDGVATCLDAKTGEKIWVKRIGGDFWASPVVADGKVYFCSKRGEVTVIEASQTFQRLAKNEFDSGFTASPAVAGDSLLLRTQTHLYRIEE